MQRLAALVIVVMVAAGGVARADSVVADVGLSVVHAGYEHDFGPKVAVAVTAGIFGTYFLPWFDLGDNVIGVGGGLRATYFFRDGQRGPYLAAYSRAQRTSGDHDGDTVTGFGITAGAFAGWDWQVSRHIDIRAGLGAQWIHQPNTDTPFIGIDGLVGWRL